MSTPQKKRSGNPRQETHRTAETEATKSPSVGPQPTSLQCAEAMSEAEAMTTTEITVNVTGWDHVMLHRIAEHQQLPVGRIASAAMNSGLHRHAEIFGIPKMRVNRRWDRNRKEANQ